MNKPRRNTNHAGHKARAADRGHDAGAVRAVLAEAAAAGPTKARVAVVLKSSLRLGDVRRALSMLGKAHRVVLVHALHLCAQTDNLRLLEGIVPRATGAGSMTIRDLVDQPMGRNDYAAMSHAAYNGSPRVARYLISQGADVHYVNSHGEDLTQNMDTGELEAVARCPSDEIFIRERFRQCRSFIAERRDFLNRQLRRGPVNYLPRRPRRVAAAFRIWDWWVRCRPARPSRPPPTRPPRPSRGGGSRRCTPGRAGAPA